MAARFTRLRIAGFKSFAEAVEVEILPGLTGIVGPNGCGKSNVAEALRWVMGESNARSLRGGEMDDVIFAGTAARPSRNLAEVLITLSQEGPAFPPPFDTAPELQIVRRIERGGGSQYRMNGKEARARDVQTLFADLASGARSSAMVSQGRIGAIVGARPEERRQFWTRRVTGPYQFAMEHIAMDHLERVLACSNAFFAISSIVLSGTPARRRVGEVESRSGAVV